jgi:hypothetical protein
MSNFLEGYELANDTIIRFRKEFPSGRVVTDIVARDLDKGYVLVKAEIFREFEDQVPSAVDFAYGNVATYPASMKKWFVEDTTTSAIARAIKLLSPTTARPSREDMARVEYEPTPSKDESDLWATLTVSQTEIETGTQSLGNVMTLVKNEIEPRSASTKPFCKHGEMNFVKSKPDSAKQWSGYFCTQKERSNQCTPVWL